MNKKLPFEKAIEQQMNDLPFPNEDESWQKMKKLLDDKDKSVPFMFFKTYKFWGILNALLLIGIGYIIRTANSAKEKQIAISANKAAVQQERPAPRSTKTLNKTEVSKSAISDAFPKTVNDQSNHSPQIKSNASTKKETAHVKAKTSRASKSSTSADETVSKQNRNKSNSSLGSRQTAGKKTGTASIKPDVFLSKSKSNNGSKINSDLQKNSVSLDTALIIQHDQRKPLITQKDSLSYEEDTVAKVNYNIKENTDGKTVALQKLKKYFVSAGIGVQQQIPVSGKQFVPYGYNGNNNLSDYIPSLYFRFEREQKWFLQGEFIYAAPQLLKSFAYSRQTLADSGSSVTTTLRLKKTFYNEIPVNFNYYLRPNLSAGIGVTYSWLHGAIAEKEINTYDRLTQTNSVVQQVVPIAGYTDSFLYKSHTYLLLQTDYQWRKLSLGLRYTKDVQPYIKYTLPDGAVRDQRNWSLQFILRLRLRKSGRF